MTSSLHHAQPILAAAINAGFRESGIQSLKNLDDPNAFPMLAIRSSGLALEYLIGYMPDGVSVERDGEGVEENITMIVSEQYLGLLLRLANERFQANTKRIRRFEKDLFRREAEIVRAWEDGKSRQERKKAEGLKQQEQVRDIRREAEKHSAANIGVNKEEDNANVLGPLLISS